MTLSLRRINLIDTLLQPYLPETEDIEILSYYGMLISRLIDADRFDIIISAVMIFEGKMDRSLIEYQPKDRTRLSFLQGLIENNFLTFHKMARNI